MVRWAFHAEDHLNKNNMKQLVTMISRSSLVLVELGSEGALTSRFFRIHDGKTSKCQFDEEVRLSEAFAPSPLPKTAGFVDVESVHTATLLTE